MEASQLEEKSRHVPRFAQLFMGVLVLLFSGTLFAWSILKAPLAEAFGWSPSVLAVNYTLTLCFLCLGGLSAGLLTSLVTTRVRLIFGAGAVFVGFLIASRLTGRTPLTLYLSFGMLAAFGIGVVYNTTIASVGALFPDMKGFASGCMMMGFGFSALILGTLANRLIAAPAFGWRSTYLLLGTLIALAVFLAAFVIDSPSVRSLKAPREPDPAGELDTRAMLKRASFWKMFFFFVTLSAVGSAVMGFARDFAVSLGAGASLAAGLTGLAAVANGLGRLLCGFLFDKKGPAFTKTVISAVALSGPLFAIAGALAGSLALGAFGLCLCAMVFGFAPTSSSYFVATFYGARHFALNFSVVNLVLIPASFFSTAAGAIITGGGSYAWVFLMLFALSAVGAVLNRTIKKA